MESKISFNPKWLKAAAIIAARRGAGRTEAARGGAGRMKSNARNTPPRALNADVYVRAGQRLERGVPQYCCWALCMTSGERYEKGPHYEAFKRVFKMGNRPGGWWGSCYEPVNQGARILGLYLMAAMVEAGDA